MKKQLIYLMAFAAMLFACGGEANPSSAKGLRKPEGVKLYSSSDDSFTFQWNPVSKAEAYDWQLLKAENGELALSGNSTRRNASVSPVSKGVYYEFQVRATAEGKDPSDWSDKLAAYIEPDGTPEPGPGPDDPQQAYAEFLIPAAEDADGGVRAFPGAEGCGMFTTGGRGGDVYHVTTTADYGSGESAIKGSLRYGIEELKDLEKKGTRRPRTIVFDVAGTIELKRELGIYMGDLTIAGQTAPGDGICIKNYPFKFKDPDSDSYQDPHNVIVRFIRCRMGDETKTADDAMTGRNSNHIIIDHCSLSWCTDECASFYGNSAFTMQWCYITESLFYSVHGKGAHGYGGIWGGEGATFHHNLIAHHTSRTPRLCGSRYTGRPQDEKVEIANNVFYNWGPINGGYAGEGGSYNFLNNYYKPGPATSSKNNLVNRIFNPNADDGKNTNAAGVTGVYHLAGNYFDSSCSALSSKQKELCAEVNTDNWTGLHCGDDIADPEKVKSGTAFQISCDGSSLSLQSAADAYKAVLACGGASLSRDAVDTRIAGEVRNGSYTYTGSSDSSEKASKYPSSKYNLGGIIDTQADAGGWPVYSATDEQKAANADSDGDGMPDWFESRFGLNPLSAADGNSITLDLKGRYTNLEMYLHYLVKEIVAAQSAE